MAGLTNKDTSFFQIESPDLEIDTLIHTRDLISLSIVEQLYQMTQGTIKLRDPNHIYSRILRIGARLKLGWGYREWDAHPRALGAQVQNLDEFTGQIERRGLEVRIDSPSGDADQQGRVSYNCNFTAIQWRGDTNVRTFASGNRADVVHTVLDELGVSRTRRDVRFQRDAETLTSETAVRQTESNFAFLTRLASREWRTFFAMNYDQAGNLWAIFVDPDLIGVSAYQNAVMGTFGRSNLLDYQGNVSNVISYGWRNNAGRSGTGDSVQIAMVNGQPTFVRYNAETQQVVTWRLRSDLVEAELERAGTLRNQAIITRDVLGARSFDEVKRFFEPIEHSTAPQGYGYEVDAKMLGNTMTMAGNLVEFGFGFPPVLGNPQTNWYARSVNHTITTEGYKMDVGVADAFSLSVTGTVL